jgi:outer membrane protein assembly factor BamB
MIYKRIFLFYFYALIIFIGSCSSEKDNSEPPTPLVELSSNLNFERLWSAYAGGGSDEAYTKIGPAFHNEQLFTASQNGIVRAFNFSDGKLLWEKQLNVQISGGPGIGNGLVLVGSHKGEVVAVSETDGSERWQAQVSSEVLAKPRISEEIVVVRTIDGKLYAFESQSGMNLWIYERNRVPLLTLRGTSTPVVKQDLIIAGFDNGKIAALELHSGKVLWEAPVAVPRGRTQLERMVDIDADPLLVDDTIYVTSANGRTIAIDLIQGKLLWEKNLSSYAGLGVDYDYLYVTDTKSNILALERDSGQEWWKQDKLKARAVTAPVNIGDYVVVGDFEGYLHWMRREDGKLVGRYKMGSASIIVPPLVIDDVLVAYDSSGNMVALKLKE